MKTRTWIVTTALLVLPGVWAAPTGAAEKAAKAEKTENVEAAEAAAAAEPAAPAPSAFDEFVAKSKNPVPWFNWGADLRLRDVYISNGVFLDKDNDVPFGRERHFQRYRGRFWSTFQLPEDCGCDEDIALNSRITWEGRHWNKPDQFLEWGAGWRGDVLFDRLNLTWKNIGGSGVTAVVGRQDIIYGTGWLVLEGTPWDGSRTIFFDAARLTFDLSEACQTQVDLVYIEQKAEPDNSWIRVIKDRNNVNAGRNNRTIEQDERGVILYVTNNTIPRTQLEGYFMMKEQNQGFADGNIGEIYTFGGAVAGAPAEKWKYRVEGGHQFGHETTPGFNQGRTVRAFGFNSRLSYLTNNETNTQYHMGFEFLSGDDPSTPNVDEAWDPLWGRWPQFSELFIYSMATETNIAEVTNLYRLGFGMTCAPYERTSLDAYYHLLWAHQNPANPRFSGHDNFRGHLLTGVLRHKFNKYVSGHIVTEFFFPGDFYADANNDPSTFLRGELVFTW